MISFPFYLPMFLLIFIIIFIFVVVFIGKTSYKSSEGETFYFRNHFPYELYYQHRLNLASYFRVMLIAMFVLMMTGMCLFVSTFRGELSNLIYALVIGIFFILSVLVAFILFVLRVNYLKQFKVYSVLLFIFVALSNGMVGIISFTSIYTHVAYKVIGGFSFALLAFNVLMMLNPKLKKWDKMDKVTNADGTISYVRPKISPLAYSLWLSMLSLVVGECLCMVSMLLTSLNII